MGQRGCRGTGTSCGRAHIPNPSQDPTPSLTCPASERDVMHNGNVRDLHPDSETICRGNTVHDSCFGGATDLWPIASSFAVKCSSISPSYAFLHILPATPCSRKSAYLDDYRKLPSPLHSAMSSTGTASVSPVPSVYEAPHSSSTSSLPSRSRNLSTSTGRPRPRGVRTNIACKACQKRKTKVSALQHVT